MKVVLEIISQVEIHSFTEIYTTIVKESYFHSSFSQKEYQGFRKCREYFKKRVLITSKEKVVVYEYFGEKADKVE